jgi:hypothetical protein
MSDTAPTSKTAWLVALVQRRSRRGWWVYVIWLLVYLFTAMMYADEMAFHSGATAMQMWPLVIPIVIVIVQWVRPSVLGWAVICLPTFLYFGVGVYYWSGITSDHIPSGSTIQEASSLARSSWPRSLPLASH